MPCYTINYYLLLVVNAMIAMATENRGMLFTKYRDWKSELLLLLLLLIPINLFHEEVSASRVDKRHCNQRKQHYVW